MKSAWLALAIFWACMCVAGLFLDGVSSELMAASIGAFYGCFAQSNVCALEERLDGLLK